MKSNKAIFFRKIVFLAVLYFFLVQKLIFGHFWNCKNEILWGLLLESRMGLILERVFYKSYSFLDGSSNRIFQVGSYNREGPCNRACTVIITYLKIFQGTVTFVFWYSYLCFWRNRCSSSNRKSNEAQTWIERTQWR